MNRFLLVSLVATAAAWVVIHTGTSARRVVPVKEAATKLQQAWADYHTVV